MIFDVHFVIVIIAFEKQATIAQVVERNIGNVEVTGPTPVSSFYFFVRIYAALSGFGETIKSYVAEGRDLNTLVSIPLAIAGWLRYLLAIDDNGNAFEVSADPLKDELQAKLSGIEFGKPETVTDQLDGILSNASIFGSDLTKTVLADKIKAYFKAEIAGAGAVRKTLHEAVNG